MFYTYIIKSIIEQNRYYIGHTTNLKQRLLQHNQGKCSHTSKYKPWKIKLYIAFDSLQLAQKFERYLKSGAGHEFAKKHFEI
jgi:putative endonuclease